MAETRLRRHDLNDSVAGATKRNESRTRQKRVIQAVDIPVAIDTAVITVNPRHSIVHRRNHSPPPQPNSHLSQSRRQISSESKEDPPLSVRALKRKKSSSSMIASRSGSAAPDSTHRYLERRESSLPETGRSIVASSSRYPASRMSSVTARPQLLEVDLPATSKKDKGAASASENSIHQYDTRSSRRHNNVGEHDRHRIHGTIGKTAFTGPLAVAEFERMKKEIETLKEALQESKKINRRQNKLLEESKAEASSAVLAMKERELELSDVKTKCRKNEELISTVEASVQCQICMDLPDKPFALAPCGHVLCLSCLQEWFRKAPPSLDDMDVDPEELTDPHYVLMRSKTCPSCRANIKHRPVPVFMVKAVAAALKKVKHSTLRGVGQNSRTFSSSLQSEEEPWKGIFQSSDEDDDGDGGDSGMESESDDEDLENLAIASGWYRRRNLRRALLESIDSTDSEMEDDEEDDDEEDDEDSDDGVEDPTQHFYVRPRWTPPSVEIDLDEYQGEPGDILKLLQRGCTWDMLQNYDVSYSHQQGIIVALRSLTDLYASDDEEDNGMASDSMNRVFLGWNIVLDEDDADGEVYITEVLKDIRDVPGRWEVTPTLGVPGALDARRLVRVEDTPEFDTTDSEAWVSD
ncbi:hypothetical protein B0H34DRAFT_704933 [Crassisporium funariophilum]|nr:hypothetical protein B0H34DRAFT_704933 [Crassisporium funariophilum]